MNGSFLRISRQARMLGILLGYLAASGCSRTLQAIPAEQEVASVRADAHEVARVEDAVVIDVTSCVLQSSFPEHGAWTPPVDGQRHALGALDTNAAYWIAALPVLDEQQRQHAYFEIEGSLPFTRYYSIHLYNEVGEICDHLTDHLIDAAPGSINPFRDHAPYPGSDRARFRLRIEQLPPDQRPVEHPGDVLYGGFARNGGEAKGMMLMLRQYGPLTREGGLIGGVALPRIHLVVDDPTDPSLPSTLEEACALMPHDQGMGPYGDFAEFEALDAQAQTMLDQLPFDVQTPVPGYNPPDPPEWILGDHMTGMLNQGFPFYPDSLVVKDINKQGKAWNFDTRYLATFLDPSSLLKPLAVARLRVPTSATGDQLGTGNAQLRYFSICIVQPVVIKPNILNPTYDCVRDDQLVRDADDPEYVTLVFGRIQDQPTGLCDVFDGQQSNCSYNWMPYAGPTPYVVYRQLVAAPDFAEATMHFGSNPDHDDPFDPEQLAEHMGTYYPRSAYCRLTALKRDLCGLRD